MSGLQLISLFNSGAPTEKLKDAIWKKASEILWHLGYLAKN